MILKETLGLTAFALMTVVASAQTSEELFKLRSPQGHELGKFGRVVAVHGALAIVGEVGAYSLLSGNPPGFAYLFDTQNGQLSHTLLSQDGAAGDYLGASVGISGSVAIVGAPFHDAAGINAGAAYLFDGSTGAQTAKLLSSTPQADAWFGRSVAVSGTTAVVGAPFEDVGGIGYVGAVYVFDTASGMQTAKLVASDGEYGDYFGFAVAIDGGTIVVGTPRDDDDGFDAGASYLFDAVTGMQTAKLHASDGGPNDAFGESVGISGARVVVGSYGDSEFGLSSGAAYLFDTSTGSQTHKLHPDDAAPHKVFGVSVAISGDMVVIGALRDSDLGYSAGAAYVFNGVAGTQRDKLLASDGSAEDLFGVSVAVSGTTIVVGAESDDAPIPSSGSAYLFSAAPVVTNYCAANPNSTGEAALMSATGSPSVAVNQLELRAEPTPDNAYIFFHGTNQIQVSFGDGFLCASGNVQRLGAPQLATGNRATLDVDLATADLSALGTFHFQCWFRDPSAGGSGFNLSDGLSVTVVP